MNYELATIYTEADETFEYETAQEYFEYVIQEDYPKLKDAKLVRFGIYKEQYMIEILIPEEVAEELYNYQEKYYEGKIKDEIYEDENGEECIAHNENLFPGLFVERESLNTEKQVLKHWESAEIIL